MNESVEQLKAFKQPPPPHLSMTAYADWVWETVTKMDRERIRKLKNIQERPCVRFEWRK
jgi:hypothetical protein